MLRRWLCIGLFGFFVFAANSAYCAPGMYISAKAGGSWLDDIDVKEQAGDGQSKINFEYDGDVTLAVAAGYDFSPVRLEMEIGWQRNDVDEVQGSTDDFDSAIGDIEYDLSDSLSSYTFLFNAYYDVKNNTPVSLILGAGLGAAFLDYLDDEVYTKVEDNIETDTYRVFDDDELVFAYQLTAGIGYDLNENTTLEVLYRFLDTEKEYTTQNAYAGVRYKF